MIKRRHPLGFTLLEMIVTMLILSILAGILTVFIKLPVDGYADTVRRAELTYQADAALQQLVREVRIALPNSLRISDGQCFEFIPVTSAGRYRAETNAAGAGDVLDFTQPDNSFDVLVADGIPNFAAGGNYGVVVYNLGVPGSDAYQISNPGNSNRAAVSNTSTSSRLWLTSANQFPDASPSRRFYLVPDYSVVYSCSGGKLWRSTRSLSSSLSPLSSCPSGGAVVMSEVSHCHFDYLSNTFQNLGQLSIRLAISREDETASLYREVYIANAP